MKKSIFYLAGFMLLMTCLTGCEKEQPWVDLALPSGTQWKNANESRYFQWEAAVANFGKELPTKEQVQELVTYCSWTWIGDGYKVVGTNGNYIYLPAAGYLGYRGYEGGVNYEHQSGWYWTQDSYGDENRYCLYINANKHQVSLSEKEQWSSIRLVKTAK